LRPPLRAFINSSASGDSGRADVDVDA